MVLPVDDIVDVVNSFPALVLDYRPGADGICILFERWRQLVTGITPTFVPPTGFAGTRAIVLNHVDLGNDVRSPVLTLYGAAGAGKPAQPTSAFERFLRQAALSCIQAVRMMLSNLPRC